MSATLESITTVILPDNTVNYEVVVVVDKEGNEVFAVFAVFDPFSEFSYPVGILEPLSEADFFERVNTTGLSVTDNEDNTGEEDLIVDVDGQVVRLNN